jgi:hypothetical protein
MDKTTEAINKALKKFPKAKKIAVENFVGTAGDERMANQSNLDMDAGLYQWNTATRGAIYQALRELGKI